ncbi:MAG: HPr-rel-A system PqqD family peptide chaperone [Pseudomonadota bacterium]|nr:HPr-rel-A system PqqD family peptide chaperone [Pseudomonadota bacterium]
MERAPLFPNVADSVCWQLHPLARLHWRRWGDSWVVYDEASGLAHSLDTLRATTLLLLEEAPATSTALAHGVEAELQTGDPTRLVAMMVSVLADLEGVRLVGHAAPAHEVA